MGDVSWWVVVALGAVSLATTVAGAAVGCWMCRCRHAGEQTVVTRRPSVRRVETRVGRGPRSDYAGGRRLHPRPGYPPECVSTAVMLPLPPREGAG